MPPTREARSWSLLFATAMAACFVAVTIAVPTTADGDDKPAQKKPAEKKHRGKIQAQGPDIDDKKDPKTVSWDQDEPPTVKEALKLVDDLEKKLSRSQKKAREKQLEKVREHIKRAGKAGGDDSHIKRSFPDKDNPAIRVDIDIFKGKAFTPDAE